MLNARVSICGVSLIEFLTAIALTLGILSGVTVAFVTSQKNQKLQYAIDEVQENAAQAFYYLKKNIREAGATGCNMPSLSYIKGQDHEVEILKTSAIAANVNEFSSQSLTVSDKPNFHKQDMLLISDCVHHEMAKIQSVYASNHSQKIILTQKLSYAYSTDAEIKRIDDLHFSVQQTSRYDQWKKPILALYVTKQNARKEELAEGISALDLLYDVEVNHALVSQHASEISDWNKVKGVEISLSVTSVAQYPLQKILHSYAALHKNFSS